MIEKRGKNTPEERERNVEACFQKSISHHDSRNRGKYCYNMCDWFQKVILFRNNLQTWEKKNWNFALFDLAVCNCV